MEEVRLRRGATDLVLRRTPGRYGGVTAAIYTQRGSRARPFNLAYASGDAADARLDVNIEDGELPALWLGRAAFDIEPREVEQVRQFLATAKEPAHA